MSRLVAVLALLTGCATTPPPSPAPGETRLPSAGMGTESLPVHDASPRPRPRKRLAAPSRSLHRPALGSRLNWSALAGCESGGNPHAVSMGRYFGLYQADITTWRGVWLRVHRADIAAARPDQTSPAVQTEFAQRLYADRGAQPWPVCGSRLYGR